MDDEEQQMYYDVLKDGTTPFDRFVSRGRMQDHVDIPGPRRKIDRYLFRTIQQTQADNSARLLPILGSAGTGKTHAYWAYKRIQEMIQKKANGENVEIGGKNIPDNWTIVYVPSPPSPVRILLHVYTCILDDMGAEIIRSVATRLIERWGGIKKKKLGIFGGADVDATIQNGMKEYPGVSVDCVKALCLHELGDNTEKNLASRWLLGEELNEDETERLGVKHIIEDDDFCLAMIKIILENADTTIVLYFDELESPYRMHGAEAEAKFLETLKRLYNEVNNIVIVIAVLKEIWERILETADHALRSRMEQVRELLYFTFDDLLLYFAKAMNYFWEQNNLPAPNDPLFPLNSDILKLIFEKTDGNQRSIIKLIRMFVDKIVYDDMSAEEALESGKKESQLPVGVTSPDGKDSLKLQISSSTKDDQNVEKSISEKIEELMQDEDYTIQANPQSVAGAAFKSVSALGERFNLKVKTTFEFKFKVGKRERTLAGLIEFGDKKVALELPSVKTFNKSGGVAAFYAVKRLADGFANNSYTSAILIVPENTGGEKYGSICDQHKDKLLVVELRDESAEWLIKAAMNDPSKEGKLMAEYVFGAEKIAEYNSPIAPYDVVPEAPENDESESSEATTSEEPQTNQE